MDFFRLADVAPQHCERVFAYSRWRAILGAALVAGSALGAFVFAWLNGAWPGYILGAALVVVLLIFQKLLTARLRASNWLLRATNNGVFIKFRSYLNDHFDDRDLTVVFVRYSEIISANLVREILELPDRDGRGTSRSARRVVALELNGECTALSKLLANERERIYGKGVVGAGRISTRYQHLPVRLVARNQLRIEWGVTPGPQSLLAIFARHSIPHKTTTRETDDSHLETLSQREQEECLLQLVESGDKVGAMSLARQLYGYDLAGAKEYVEGLVRRQIAR